MNNVLLLCVSSLLVSSASAVSAACDQSLPGKGSRDDVLIIVNRGVRYTDRIGATQKEGDITS